MNNYVLAWDVETTGLSPREDFIIQLAAARFDKTTGEVVKTNKWYIKPAHAYEISPKAQEVHGLTKEFIEENGKYFKDVAPEFFEMMEDADLLTYNGNSFDVKFLYEECKRWGLEFPVLGKKCFDAFSMECRLTPRTLSAVFEKYMGYQFEDAHDALSDVLATVKVFQAQIANNNLAYDEIENWEENNIITPDGTIRYNQPGDEKIIVFAVGKYRDCEFMDVCKKDPGYIKWYMTNLASDYTKSILNEYYAKNRSKLDSQD